MKLIHQLLEIDSYQEVHVVGGTADTAVTSHRVQREGVRPGAGGDPELELQEPAQD